MVLVLSLILSSCTSLIPESVPPGEGVAIVQVDTVASVSPEYDPKIIFDITSTDSGISLFRKSVGISDGFRSFVTKSGEYSLIATPTAKSRNGGSIQGNSEESASFVIEEGVLLVFDYKLEFLMSGDSDPVCRWVKLSPGETAEIGNQLTMNKDSESWSLSLWDSEIGASADIDQ